MKANIHPTYYDQVQVTCSCGNSFVTGSTKQALKVELCSNCHPFYTGTQKLVDTEGKVEKFARKQKLAKERKQQVIAKKEQVERTERPSSLAEMVAAIRKQQKSS